MTARFRFGEKEEPNYNPYGTVFTDRQQAIINGDIVRNLKKTEVTKIIRKAEKLELFLCERRRGLGILFKIAFWWWVVLLLGNPVKGLRPLRERTGAWDDEVCL